MTWEYTCIYSGSHGESVLTQLNEAGAVGWELVAVVHGWHYLKRPRVEVKAAAAKPRARKAAKK